MTLLLTLALLGAYLYLANLSRNYLEDKQQYVLLSGGSLLLLVLTFTLLNQILASNFAVFEKQGAQLAVIGVLALLGAYLSKSYRFRW